MKPWELDKPRPQELVTAWWWVARTFWRPEAPVLVALVTVQLAGAVLAGLQPRALGGLVASVGTGTISWGWVAVLLVSVALPQLTAIPVQLANGRLQRRLTLATDDLLIGVGERLVDLGLLDNRDFRDDADRQHQWAMAVPSLFDFSTAVVMKLVTLVVMALSVASLGWWIPPLLLAVAIPAVAIAIRNQQMMHDVVWKNNPDFMETFYTVEASITPNLAREVRVFGLGDYLVARHARHTASSLRRTTRARLRQLVWVAVFALVNGLAVVGIFGFGRASLTAAGLTVLISSVLRLAASFADGANQWSMAWYAVRQVAEMDKFLQKAQPTIALAEPGLEAPHRYATGLTLRGVEFSYDDDNPVLTGVDLHVPAGKVLALVGENGEGKSTLVRLLTRLNDPTAGSIELDGRPIAEYSITSLRDGMATVFQDHAHFALRVFETVGMGDPELLTNPDSPQFRARLEQALVHGGADRIVAENGGLDEQLGRGFGGVEFSGGEWQRLSTSRAFVPDAALVVMDEPTSAIDVDSERRLFDHLAELMRGRTAVIISHRFSTVRKADLIAVLSGGRIVEYGSHAELMARGGLYAELFETQASRYAD